MSRLIGPNRGIARGGLLLVLALAAVSTLLAQPRRPAPDMRPPSPRRAARPPDPLQGEDAEVLSSVYSQERKECGTTRGIWLVSSTTTDTADLSDILAGVAHLGCEKSRAERAALANFRHRNARRASLPPLHAGLPFQVIDQSRIDAFFPKHPDGDIFSGWRAFHRAFPDVSATCHFSLPGFSPDHSTAILWFSEQQSWVGGHGGLRSLTKIRGRWKETGWFVGYLS